MQQQEDKAINAIWKTDLGSPEAKLVLYQLASRHELGDRYSSSWKTAEQFVKDFEQKWSTAKEIAAATQLTEVKFERVADNLVEKGYVATKELEPRVNKKGKVIGKTSKAYAITSKIFEEFAASAPKQKAG